MAYRLMVIIVTRRLLPKVVMEFEKNTNLAPIA